jgi:hypothetical protein
MSFLQRRENYAHGSEFNPQILFHFLMSLLHKRETMLIASDSFFNGFSIEKRKLCSWTLLDHGFQENNALEGHHVKGQNSVIVSKRSSLDGRNSLWKEHMSRAATRVRISGSNSPTEEITMSTTGSKSSGVEVMGDNAT